MKKIIFSALSLSFLVSSLTAQETHSKIGYINAFEILQQIPEIKEVENKVQKYEADLQASLDKQALKWQEDYTKLMTEVDSGIIAPKVQKVRETDLMNRRDSLQQLLNVNKNEIKMKRDELMKPVLEKFQTVIKETAVAHKLEYVISIDPENPGSGFVIDGHDISADIRKKLNIVK